MITYDIFFRRFGVRLPQHLMAPTISTLDKFQFPKNSLYHNLTFDGVRVGPSADDFVYRNVPKQVMMAHVLALGDTKGNPRKVGASVIPYINEYHSRNRKFRNIKSIDKIGKDETFLNVLNYGFLPKMYRYIRSMYTVYYKWWNLQKTMWLSANAAAEVSNRQQFFFVSLPKHLPSISTLNKYSTELNSTMAKIFSTPESLFLLEIWKWLSEENRDDSVLSGIQPEVLPLINIVFQEGNNWIMVNLGVLNSWRYVEDPENPVTTQKVKLDPINLQKRFLRLLMGLMALRNAPVDAEEQSEAAEIAVVTGTTDEGREHDEETRLEEANRKLDTLDSDLAELETLEKHVSVELQSIKAPSSTGSVDLSDFHREEPLEGAVIAECDKLADDGVITMPVYRNLVAASKNYKSLIAPDGETTLEKYIDIQPKEIEIAESPVLNDIPTVLDKSMLKSSLFKFDEHYIEHILPKDVASMVVNIQKAGVVLSNYNVEKEDDILGGYEIHTLRVRPVEGTASTLRFKLPKVDPDGVVMYNGNKYRMRKQRGDVPIRKISPDTVALTSYYGKTFVTRSPKRVNNYSGWLNNQIMSKGLDGSDTDITDLATANMFDNQFDCPRLYSSLAMQFKSFTAGGYKFNFDHKQRAALYGQANLDKYEKDGLVIFADDERGTYLGVDKHDAVYELKGAQTTLKGTVESFLGIDQTSAPVEFAEVKIFGKAIPVGFILAYQLGLTNLLNMLKVEPRKVAAGQRLNRESNEYAITFGDCSLIFNKEDKLASMILAGLSEYEKVLRKYNLDTMDKPNVYLNILESSGLTPRYLREIDLFTALFVDPITRSLLIEMNEPTNVQGLLVRSSQLLLSDKHPDQLDMRYMRIKGYERLAGAVYSELVQSVRAHKSRAGRANRPLELHPYAVWKRVVQDPAMNMVSDINPIENIKEMEAITYSGTGGRSARSMTKSTREYHETDVGVISEATKDSSHVGVNIYTSADPQFKSLRGTTRPYVDGVTGISSVLSSSALLAPGSNHDDPKRVNFISIQNGHGIACKGYRQGSVRTGYEQVIAHRTSDLFAYTARQNGVVVSRNDTGIQIKYADGSIKGIEIGRRFGNAAGLVIPHNVVCDLKTGDKFNKGDVVVYNDGFFEKDLLNPSQVVWKVGITVKTVLYESNQTLEDASSISKRVSDLLTTKTTKVKTVVVGFDQIVRDMVKAGDSVEPESILCTIEDAVTGNSNLFNEESLNTLRLLSNQTPTAKVRGVVERVEVYYHGQRDDMSESLKAISASQDRELSSRSRSSGKSGMTGSVNSDLRIDGEPLMLDTVAIRFYITSDVNAGVGDKGVFCNQMKTVFSEVLPYEMKTESGETIDAVFGQKSINDRIVLSPELIGTTGTLLGVIGKQAAQIYRKK